MKHMISRNVVLVLLNLLFCFPVHGQDPVEESSDRFIGRVKSVRTESVEFSFASGKRIKGQRILSSIIEYDPGRKPIETTTYKRNGEIEHVWTPPVDPNESIGLMGGSHMETVEFRIRTEVDERGNLIKESDYTMEGTLLGWREYQYDTAGNRVEERDYDGGALQHREVHIYDEQGNKIATIRIDALGEPEGHWEFRYDKKKRLIEETTYLTDVSVFAKACYRYDDIGNPTEEAHYDHGNVLSTKSSYSYEYDATGNWIKRITRVNTEPTANAFLQSTFEEDITEVIYRTITYY